jgi:hypothetical protein
MLFLKDMPFNSSSLIKQLHVGSTTFENSFVFICNIVDNR